MNDADVMGKPVRVKARIAPGVMGEVCVAVRGGSEDYLAIGTGTQEFAVNASAIVVDMRPPRLLVVATPETAMTVRIEQLKDQRNDAESVLAAFDEY